MRYSWTQPCCDDCWDERNPDRPSLRLRIRESEQCVYCGLFSQSGIYVRIDPEDAPFPSLKKD